MGLKENQNEVYGSALGPDWSFDLAMKGQNKEVCVFSFSSLIQVSL